MKENNTIKFMMNYKIPDRYINKNASIEKIDNEYNWKDTWYNKSSTVDPILFNSFIGSSFIDL